MSVYIQKIPIPPEEKIINSKYNKSVLTTALLKDKYGSRNFWCIGYYTETVGGNKKVIEEYIKNKLEEDFAQDQMSIKEYFNPFMGDKKSKQK